jgi:hypothetical protein
MQALLLGFHLKYHVRDDFNRHATCNHPKNSEPSLRPSRLVVGKAFLNPEQAMKILTFMGLFALMILGQSE